MITRKRGQGLPINIIIIAVLLLVVLITVTIVFRSSFGKSVKRFDGCTAQGGICRSGCEDTEQIYQPVPQCDYLDSNGDSQTNGKCCIQKLV